MDSHHGEDEARVNGTLDKSGSPSIASGPRKRPLEEDVPSTNSAAGASASPPHSEKSLGGVKIAERARLSLQGARAVAGRTIHRWTSNIAAAASSANSALANAQNAAVSSSPPPPPLSPREPAARVSATLDVTDATLLRIAARPPGCLFDDAFLSRLSRELKESTESKRHRLVEVQFKDRAGLTLDVSQLYPERVYVDGFSSDESPALLTRAIMVGDTLLSAAGGDRWLRSTGNLEAISQFIRDCSRPVTIRFLRDLEPVLTIERVHQDPGMAAYWLDFLTNSGVSTQSVGAESDQVLAVDPQTLQLRSIWDGKAMAQFALDARFSDRTKEEIIEAIVERHLPSARSPAEQALIDWYNARRAVAESDEVNSDAVNQYQIQVFEVLDKARESVEDGLSQAYFKRFLHSGQALALLREFNLPYDRSVVKACATDVSLDAVLSRRALANLFLAHCLPRDVNAYRNLLLWIDIEYSLSPALDQAEIAFSENRSQNERYFALRRVWVAATRVYERFLSSRSACYCGQFPDNTNENFRAAVKSISKESWSESAFCEECGRENVALRRSLEERISGMEADPIDIGFIALESLRSIAVNLQTRLVDILGKPFSNFCQDPMSWFPIVVEAFNVEVAAKSNGTDTQSIVPRISTILQYGETMAKGVETHRAPTNYYAAVASSAPLVLGAARFALFADTLDVETLETHGLVPDGLVKFAFPWLPAAANTSKGSGAAASPRPREGSSTGVDGEPSVTERSMIAAGKERSLCFNFVMGSEKIHGVTHVDGQEALVIISQQPLFDKLRKIALDHVDGDLAELLRPLDDTLETCYGKGVVIGSNENVTFVRVGELMTVPIENHKNDLGASACASCEECGVAYGKDTTETEIFWFPPTPKRDYSFDLLQESLSPHNMALVFASLLLEKKILLVSSRYTVLTAVSESLCALLHPLRWSHVYAPLLPRKMLDLLMCPTPFFIGIHSEYAFKGDFPFAADMVVVDLDADEVTSPTTLIRLPAHIERKLLRDLKEANCPRTAHADDAEEYIFDATPVDTKFRDRLIAAAFRSTVLSILSKVQLACFPVEHRGERVTFINEQFWLDGRRTDEYEFLIALLRTQAFSSYVAGVKA